jgi:hypothetical protein
MKKPTSRFFSLGQDQPVKVELEAFGPMVRHPGQTSRLAGPNFSFPAAGAQRFSFSTSPSPNFSVCLPRARGCRPPGCLRQAAPQLPSCQCSAFASPAPAGVALRAACGRRPRNFPAAGAQRFSFSSRGSSLVTTLLVVTVLTIIVVAFMQSMGIERMTSRSYANVERARLAAEAGVNAAVQQLAEAISSTNFSVVRDRAVGSAENWPLVIVNFNQQGVPISTNNIRAVGDELADFPFDWAELRQETTPLYSLTNSSGQTNAAFAYSVIDKGALQNLKRFPEVQRSYTTTLNEIPLISKGDSPYTEDQLQTIEAVTQSSPNVSSLNQAFDLEDEGFPAFSEEWVSESAMAPALAPDGKPKIDLRRFKFYIDSLSVSQALGNPKSQVVEALLGQTSSIDPSVWGGGDLIWLVSDQNPNRYTLQEARQIAANLIDYLDSDLHPTTDNINSPSYLGVEARFTPEGTVRGHPYVTALGHGLVFNISTAAGFNGWLNSTRVLTFWSLVNPWSENILNFSGFYRVELEVEILGTAAGGTWGEAQQYFLIELNERLTEGPSFIRAHGGSTFPQNPSGLSFANMNSLQPLNRQPPGIQFSNVQFRIRKARLNYTDTSGLTSAVQILDGLRVTPLNMNPPSFTLPSAAPPTSVVYNPGSVANAYFLASDPRENFRSTSWQQGQLTPAEAGSTTPPGGSSVINVFSNMNPVEGDGQQGVPSNHTWYTSTNTTNHFFVRSPAQISNPSSTTYSPITFPPPTQLAVDSIGEIGYLWTGRPWQTFRLVETNAVPTSTRRDYKLLDYINAGTFTTRTNLFRAGYLSEDGKINPATALRPTALGIFRNVPGLPEANGVALAEFMLNSTQQPLTPGDLGQFTEFLTPAATTKFAREDLLRRIINQFSTSPQEFVIQARGEARDPNNPQRVVASAMFTASVIFVQNPENPAGPPLPVITSLTRN